MKKTILWGRYALLFLTIAITHHPDLWAQHNLVNEYLKEAGNYAQLYNGEVATIYNPFVYKNGPYYKSEDYVVGELTYRGNMYPSQQIRLDLYKDQLVVLVPGVRLGVIVNPYNLNEANIYGRTVIYHTPLLESGLREGYYVQLHAGLTLQLLGRFTMKLSDVKDDNRKYYYLVQRYYIVHNGTYYPVRNGSAFSKLFPTHKKEIKGFIKVNGLTFSENSREEDLTKLAEFCEEITQRTIL